MKKAIFLSVIVLSILIRISCNNDPTDFAVMGVEFQWLPIDHNSHKDPEILLTDVPEGTKRFLVSLVDLDLKSYNHGDGFVLNAPILDQNLGLFNIVENFSVRQLVP